jgi:hypothetical protein
MQGQFTRRLIRVKWSYTVISISDEGKFGGVRKWLIIIQRATGFLFLFYFMKSFKFQCLLGLNGQSIEI